MNFFKLYIGDYQRDTAHLSVTEHGCYLLMLQHYYATERPLPAGKALHRMLRCQDKAERDAADAVAAQFWTATEAGLVNDRADAEITKASAQADTNARIARDREDRRKAARTEHERSTNRATNGQPNQTPDTRHQENTKTARKRAAPAVLVCVDDLVAEGVERQHATDWLVARKAKGLPLTPTAWQQTKDEAKKARMSPAEAIKTAAGMQWAGFKASWLEDGGRGSGAGNGKPAVDAAAETLRALDAGKLTEAERVASREAKERVMAQLRTAIRVVS